MTSIRFLAWSIGIRLVEWSEQEVDLHGEAVQARVRELERRPQRVALRLVRPSDRVHVTDHDWC